MAWTLTMRVTDVFSMEAVLCPPTAVESRTGVVVAALLVLPTGTVQHSVTSHVHRQAVSDCEALEVGLWAQAGRMGVIKHIIIMPGNTMLLSEA